MEYGFETGEEPTEEEMEQMESDYAKYAGQQIAYVDRLYDFVNGLDKAQLDAFLQLTKQFGTSPTTIQFWSGYSRALRYAKFDVNPNPYVPKLNPEDFIDNAETEEEN